MTDSTNNVNIDNLIQKYLPVLETLHRKEFWVQYAQIFEISIDYINAKHKGIDYSWKIWTTLLLVNLVNEIKTNEDVHKIVDEFVKYINDNYKNYCDNLGMSSTDFDKNYLFMSKFINFRSEQNHKVNS